jgi:hypothetical protein
VNANNAKSNVVVLASDGKKFLDLVQDTAKKSVKGFNAIIEMFQRGEIDWANSEQVGAISRAFRIGHIAGTLGVDLTTAALISDKSKYRADADNPDERRTQDEDRAYNAGKSRFDHYAKLSGMPPRAGGTRKPRQTVNDIKALAVKEALEKAGAAPTDPKAKAAAAKVAKSEALVTVLTSPPSSEADVVTFALKIADLIAAFDKRIGKTHAGPWKSVLADVARTLRATAKAPVEVAEPAIA